MSDEVERRKGALRAAVRERRNARSDAERAAETAGLTEQLITLVRGREARTLSCYFPVRSEPDTRGFLEWARAEDLEVLFPSSRDDGLVDWIRTAWEGTVTGKFGIPEPLGDLLGPIAVNDVDLMLIPACAVDRRGVRLGWGRGYFDKTLGSMDRRPPVFAVIHDDELVGELPNELHDVPVTGVVTPTQILYLDDVSRGESSHSS